MKPVVVFLWLSVLFIAGCKDDATPVGEDFTLHSIVHDTIPNGLDTSIVHSCIQEKVAYLESRGADADTTAIVQYYYNGQIVYLYYTECCDRYNALYDSACNMICFPSGGIAGNGDGSCSDFSERAVFIKKIWEKY